jgi:hypothetical protein
MATAIEHCFSTTNKGANIEICERGSLARRTASFANGATYIPEPLQAAAVTVGTHIVFGYMISVSIVEHQRRVGGLRMGITITDPSTIDFACARLNELQCTIMANFSNSSVWLFDTFDTKKIELYTDNAVTNEAPLRKPHGVGDVVRMVYTPHDAMLFLEFNSEIVLQVRAPPKWRSYHLNHGGKLWGVVEVCFAMWPQTGMSIIIISASSKLTSAAGSRSLVKHVQSE